ncbi:protein WFDC11-like [Peromyscus leucopus]|uniref:protein WFDC11-like n=1 Tax=Peromyscus leucopus TaxID=10041 RepID=UPI0010A12D97|nr:protein WFDC11-like [Peromyscus leucopus]
MKPSMLLLVLFLCVLLLPAPGWKKKKYSQRELSLQECWGQPKVNDCRKKCSRRFRCLQKNHTCCWTYCGNICAPTGTFLSTHWAPPDFSVPSGQVMVSATGVSASGNKA